MLERNFSLFSVPFRLRFIPPERLLNTDIFWSLPTVPVFNGLKFQGSAFKNTNINSQQFVYAWDGAVDRVQRFEHDGAHAFGYDSYCLIAAQSLNSIPIP